MTKPASPTRPLDEATVAVRALVRVSRLLETRLEELSLPHYRLLAALSSGEEIASRIAARLALGRPAISASVAALTDRGFVERTVVDGDLRAAGLWLTPAGREALSRADESMAAELLAIAAKTPDPERLVAELAQLHEPVTEVRAERRAARAASASSPPVTAASAIVAAVVPAKGPAKGPARGPANGEASTLGVGSR